MIHSTAVTLMVLEEFNLNDTVVELPKIYNQVIFTLMVSKRSPNYGKLIPALDETLVKMKADGRYRALVNRAHSRE